MGFTQDAMCFHVQPNLQPNSICFLKLLQRFRKKENIYVDELVSVSDQEVPEDPSFVQVPQTDHVLHPVDGGRVHGLDVGGVLRGDPVLLHRNRYIQHLKINTCCQ